MPSRRELPSGISRTKFAKALVRLGFEIDVSGGSGSHFKATWPKNQKSITLPQRFDKDVLYYILKEIEKVTPITWEKIKEEL